MDTASGEIGINVRIGREVEAPRHLLAAIVDLLVARAPDEYEIRRWLYTAAQESFVHAAVWQGDEKTVIHDAFTSALAKMLRLKVEPVTPANDKAP